MNFQWHSNYHRPQLVPHAQAVELIGRTISDLVDFFKDYPTPSNGYFIGPLIWQSPKLQWQSAWTDVKPGKAKYAMLSMGSSGATKLSASLIRSLVELDFEVLYSGSKRNCHHIPIFKCCCAVLQYS